MKTYLNLDDILNPYFLTEAKIEVDDFFEYFSTKSLEAREIWRIFRVPSCIITGGKGTGKTVLGRFISYRYQQYFYDHLKEKKEYSKLYNIINDSLQGKKFWGIYTKAENPNYLYEKDEEKARKYAYILGTTLDLKIVEELCRSLENLARSYTSSSYVKEYIRLDHNKIEMFVMDYLKILKNSFKNIDTGDDFADLNKLCRVINYLYNSYRDAWDYELQKVKPFCLLKFTSTFINKLHETGVINPDIRTIIIIDEIEYYEKLPHKFALRLLNEFIYKIAREQEFSKIYLVLIGRTYGTKVKECLTSDQIIEKSRGLYDIINLNKLWENKFERYQQFVEDTFIKRLKDLNIVKPQNIFGHWSNSSIDYSKLDLIYHNTLKNIIGDIKKDYDSSNKTLFQKFDEIAKELRCNDIETKMFLLALIANSTRRKKRGMQEIIFDEKFKKQLKAQLSDKKLRDKYNKKIRWVLNSPVEKLFGWDCMVKTSYPYIVMFLTILNYMRGREKIFEEEKLSKEEVKKEVQYDSLILSSKEFRDERATLVPGQKYLFLLENLATLLKDWQNDLTIIEFPIGIKINKEKINSEEQSMLDVAEAYDLLYIKEDLVDDSLLISPASPTLPYYRLCPFAEDYIELDDIKILRNKEKEYVKIYAKKKFEIINKAYIKYPERKTPKFF